MAKDVIWFGYAPERKEQVSVYESFTGSTVDRTQTSFTDGLAHILRNEEARIIVDEHMAPPYDQIAKYSNRSTREVRPGLVVRDFVQTVRSSELNSNSHVVVVSDLDGEAERLHKRFSRYQELGVSSIMTFSDDTIVFYKPEQLIEKYKPVGGTDFSI